MDDIPNVNTSSWRLPKRGTASIAKFTPDKYTRVGLDVPPDRKMEEGASPPRTDVPTVDTTGWRLPRRRREEDLAEALPPPTGTWRKPVPGEILPVGTHVKGGHRGYFIITGKGVRGTGMIVDYAAQPKRRVKNPGRLFFGKYEPFYLNASSKKTQLWDAMVNVPKGKRVGKPPAAAAEPAKAKTRIVRTPKNEPAESPDEIASGVLAVRWNEMRRAGWRAVKRPLKKGEPLSDLEMMGPLPGLKVKQLLQRGVRLVREDTLVKRQRLLAGLETKPHIDFATGMPHREIPEMDETGIDDILAEQYEAPRRQIPVGEKVRITDRERLLAGMTNRVVLPHPVHDERKPYQPQGQGLFDEGRPSGDEFINQVLAESRWFFGEAPAGRSGPWRGSEDEPAKTPIARKGKAKGYVGDKKSKTDDEGEVEEQRMTAGQRAQRSGTRIRELGRRMARGTAASQRSREKHIGRLKKYLKKKHGVKFDDAD